MIEKNLEEKQSFTDAQREAIRHKEGPALVLAGPGAGKTLVLTQRVQFLVEQAGVDPGCILVLTFTNAAAEQMRSRFAKSVPRAANAVTFGTFHSLFFRILSKAYGLRGEQILRASSRKEIYEDILKKISFEVPDAYDFYKAISMEIGRVKERLVYGDRKDRNGLKAIEDYHAACCPDAVFQRFYSMYVERMHAERWIDFEDMGVMCYELLTARSDILHGWQQRFTYLLVDEMQDTNELQYDIVRMLARPQNHLMMVGDDDQSIYHFRGAKPEIMLHFPEDFPNGKQIVLDRNFRSVPEIVEASLRLIGHNQTRYPKQIFAAREQQIYWDGAGAIVTKAFSDSLAQKKFLTQEIVKLHEQGVSYEEIVILYRTNLQAQSLVMVLQTAGIPFSMREMIPDLFEHWIVKDVLAYILLAQQYSTDCEAMDRKLFLQVMNRPKRYLKRELIQTPKVTFEGLSYAVSNQRYLVERLEKLERDLKMLSGYAGREALSPYAAVHYIRHVIGYDEYLSEYAQLRGGNLEDFAMVLDELEASAKAFETVDEWFAFMETSKKRLEEQKRQSRRNGTRTEAECGVSLMTYHTAKGLEFSYAFLIDIVEGLTPYRKAEKKEELEEERRMLYVALTRAKDRVYLLRPMERLGKTVPASRFLEEIFDLQSDLKVGVRVMHSLLGRGTIKGVSEGKIMVYFERSKKVMTLQRRYCMENQLLVLLDHGRT